MDFGENVFEAAQVDAAAVMDHGDDGIRVRKAGHGSDIKVIESLQNRGVENRLEFLNLQQCVQA